MRRGAAVRADGRLAAMRPPLCRSPSPTPPKGYRHHSPAAPPPEQQRATDAARPLTPAVAALDLSASTVLITGPPVAGQGAEQQQHQQPAGRKSFDSAGSGQSWEVVDPGTALHP